MNKLIIISVIFVLVVISIFVIFFKFEESIDPSISCNKDSDCVSASGVGCNTECEFMEGRDCSLLSLCPAININNFEPLCDKSVSCIEPTKIFCDEGMCKSSECEVDSDCGSATEYGCYISCSDIDEDCSKYDRCPVMSKENTVPCDESWGICNEPKSIRCENNKCHAFD